MKKICLILLLAAASASADDGGLRRCSAIKEASARLACFDDLAAKALSAPAGAPAPAPAAAPAAAPPAAAAASKPAVPAAGATAPDAQQQFGLEQRAPKDQLQTIESYIPGHFEGWGPGTRFTLANGQVWQVSDDSSLYLNRENPKVIIRRAMFGSFFMDFERENRSPRVRRIR
jgi:hypothetical protein